MVRNVAKTDIKTVEDILAALKMVRDVVISTIKGARFLRVVSWLCPTFTWASRIVLTVRTMKNKIYKT